MAEAEPEQVAVPLDDVDRKIIAELTREGIERGLSPEAARAEALVTDALARVRRRWRRFHRDSGIGRLFHPGRLSLRENVPSNSLHVVVEDNRSMLKRRREGVRLGP